MDYKDYYKVLGVAKTASDKEIRQAYRKLARQLHPDLKPGDKAAEKRFKEVNEAYEVLGDAEKRKKYDELGANWKAYEQWQRTGGAATGPDPFAAGAGRPSPGRARTVTTEDLGDLFGEESPFSDFFQTFFGGMRDRARTARAPRPRPGQDIEQPMEITVEEAARGTTRVLQISDEDGRNAKRIEVKIPAGVTAGSRVRVAGQGNAGTGGATAGDLYLRISIASSETFALEGNATRVRVAAPLTTAVLGGEVEVPTPRGGRVALKIPPQTQNGRVFRLRGQGMPASAGVDPGDLLAEIRVVLPESLTPRQRELFEELARLESPAAAAR